MTIWNLEAGKTIIVESIENCSEKFLKRLEELGITIGSELTCLKALPFNGPKVYKLSDSIFSLDRDIAIKINFSH